MGDGRKLLTVFVLMLVFAMLTATTASAQEDPPVNTGKISFDGGLDITTAYFFRGANQEDGGFIAQPYGQLGASVFEDGTGVVKSLDLYAGIWNSFHSKQTGATTANDGPDSWYEADLYAGMTIGMPAGLEADVSYIAYTSPSDAFDTIQEIDLAVGYDDSELWGGDGFALNPSAVLAFEIDNTLLGADEGIYLGIGIEPAFSIIESEGYPVTLSVPVTVGLGLDDYYEHPTTGDNETFGFASVKPTLSMPLKFMPADYGTWEVSASVELLYLGDTNEALNDADDFQAIGTVGLSMSY